YAQRLLLLSLAMIATTIKYREGGLALFSWGQWSLSFGICLKKAIKKGGRMPSFKVAMLII
ncbi:MAG: hypothetical protein OSB07_09860, partial [Dehalococcoidia bacterium]|nr:hypothetical protein [Dehalococcoidia bacterium]